MFAASSYLRASFLGAQVMTRHPALQEAFDRLFEWLNAHELVGTDVRMFGAFYDDPATVASGQAAVAWAAVVNQTVDLDPRSSARSWEAASPSCSATRAVRAAHAAVRLSPQGVAEDVDDIYIPLA